MSFEIHMYSAVARAFEVERVAQGQHHPMLIFLRQSANEEHDLGRAAAVAERLGWTEVDITRAGTLPPEAGAQMEGPVRLAYSAAVEHGEGLMMYETPVAEGKKAG